MLTKFI